MRFSCVWSVVEWYLTFRLPPFPHGEMCSSELEHQQGGDRSGKEINVPVQRAAPGNGWLLITVITYARMWKKHIL